MGTAENKLISYCKKHSTEYALIKSIAQAMLYERSTLSDFKVISDAHTHVMDTLTELFGEDEKLIKHPLAVGRGKHEELAESIGLKLDSDAALNAISHYRHFLMYVHRNLTLKLFIENNQQKLDDQQKLAQDEQESAEIVIHAFNVFVHHRDWLTAPSTGAKVMAELLSGFTINTNADEYGEVIEGKFGIEGLGRIGAHNLELFKALAYSAIRDY